MIEVLIWQAARYVDHATDMRSSAQFCLDEARRLYSEGKIEYARRSALKSLSYSVGIFHPVYKALNEN